MFIDCIYWAASGPIGFRRTGARTAARSDGRRDRAELARQFVASGALNLPVQEFHDGERQLHVHIRQIYVRIRHLSGVFLRSLIKTLWSLHDRSAYGRCHARSEGSKGISRGGLFLRRSRLRFPKGRRSQGLGRRPDRCPISTSSVPGAWSCRPGVSSVLWIRCADRRDGSFSVSRAWRCDARRSCNPSANLKCHQLDSAAWAIFSA